MSKVIFVVYCERIRKTNTYQLNHQYNIQFNDRISELSRDLRSFNKKIKKWELNVEGLFNLMSRYKKSNKIFFAFGLDDETIESGKKEFIELVQKMKINQVEKDKMLVELEKKKKLWVNKKEELEVTYLKYWDVLHNKLNEGVKLYPHQVTAAMFLNEVKNALLSHEMGLGKTLSSIAYIELNTFEKVFVITPNSLKFNFYDEVEKFTGSKSHIINWKKNKYSIEEAKYVIVNYDYFRTGDKKKMNIKWKELGITKIDTLICDECHKLKNTKSNTYRNFKRIFTNKTPSKIFLSGTPAPNRAYELYSVLNQISSLDFPTKEYFYEYFCGIKYDKEEGGWVTNIDDTRFEELYHKIAPYTHRKRKKEVLTDLPDKIYQKIPLEISSIDYHTYYSIAKGVANNFIADPTQNPLTQMLRLRQFLSSLKIKHICEIVEAAIETGDKIVIVDMFKDSLYALKEKFPDISELHTGDQSVEERAEVVRRFQDPNSNIKIFLGSIQTCNYGLTLTAADKLFILSLPFSPGEYDQVADRLHRIGQKNVVNIYSLIFLETIDEYVYGRIETKKTEIAKAIDNEDYTSVANESILSEVVEMIKKEYG